MTFPDPVIQEHEGFFVVRDDLLPGGTKRRVLGGILRDIGADEYVYPSTAFGYGPLAVAHACKDIGKKSRLFYPKRNRQNWTKMMLEAEAQGAEIVMVPRGYMSVLQCRARAYCEENAQAHLLPLGFDTDEFKNRLVGLVKNLILEPEEVWCATGSGALTRALQEAWPKAQHHTVIIARKSADTGAAVRHEISLAFEKAAKNLPPFPSAPNYDAKVWEVMKRYARPGALLWNVGG